MKIKRFNESVTNYNKKKLMDILSESEKLTDIIFKYYYELEDIDIEEEYINQRNITIVGDNIVLWYDDEGEMNASAFINCDDALINFINNYEIKKDANKYNL